eukprot:275168-Pyramimonas_sp.AAC.1
MGRSSALGRLAPPNCRNKRKRNPGLTPPPEPALLHALARGVEARARYQYYAHRVLTALRKIQRACAGNTGTQCYIA